MGDGSGWIDQIVEGSSYEWERTSPTYVQTMLGPQLPCRVSAGKVDGHPVLYVAIGINGTPRYWQWATLDQKTHQPLPKAKALHNLWRLINLVLITSESQVVGELIS